MANSRAITPKSFKGSGWLLNSAKRLCQQTMSQSLMMIHWKIFKLQSWQGLFLAILATSRAITPKWLHFYPIISNGIIFNISYESINKFNARNWWKKSFFVLHRNMLLPKYAFLKVQWFSKVLLKKVKS